MSFCTVPEALEELRQGRMIIVVDDPDSDREGDLVMAAEKVTPEAINFMSTMGRGLICLALTGERARELELPLMVNPSQHMRGTAFTITMDARGIASGSSAYERAYTIRRAADPAAGPDDFVRPGHVFPLRARDGGVLERTGHAEAAVELTRLAGLYPAGVLCNVMAEDGTMARVSDLAAYARRHGLKLCSVADLVAYVRTHWRPELNRTGETQLRTRFGSFRAISYEDRFSSEVNMALTLGEVGGGLPVLVRVHCQCTLGEAFGSLRCNCDRLLDSSLREIQENGSGVLIYLQQESRGEGLSGKVQIDALQDQVPGHDDWAPYSGHQAEDRDFAPAAWILKDLGVQQVRLLTNIPEKAAVLEELGLDVVECLPLTVRQGG